MQPKRLAAVGSVALTGVAVLASALLSYVSLADSGLAALALTILGILLGVALFAGASYLHRADISATHTVRIAGWNALGVVVLGAVLAGALATPDVSLPTYVVADVLGVSAVAHVLIGYNDVRRIRAQDLAREREKLAMLNRLTRHNLRNETQILTSTAEQLVDDTDDPGTRQLAINLRDKAVELSELHEDLQVFQDVVEDHSPQRPVELQPLVEDVLEDFRENHPSATIETDVPAGLTASADDHLTTALEELVENAIEHGNPVEPWVSVTAEERKGLVTLTVLDNGPGIPADEIEAVTGEREISQLKHASGLGLWIVSAVVERYDGQIEFDHREHGSAVSLWLTEA